MAMPHCMCVGRHAGNDVMIIMRPGYYLIMSFDCAMWKTTIEIEMDWPIRGQEWTDLPSTNNAFYVD